MDMQNRRLKPWLRAVALVTVIAVTTTSTVSASGIQPNVSASKASAADLLPQKAAGVLDNLNLPSSIGEIKKVFRGSLPGVVIHIQDAHVNEEAQKNIGKILHYFSKNHGLQLVNLEGGSGELYTELFSFFPDKNVRKDVSEYYLREGRLSGAEYQTVVEDNQLKLYGVEDKALYRRNKEAYLDALHFKEKDETLLSVLGEALKNTSRFVFSDELRELYRRREAFQDGGQNLADYARYITELAGKNKIAVHDYAGLHSLIAVFDLEKEINFETAEAEILSLGKDLKSLLSREQMTRYLTYSVQYRMKKMARRDYYRYLESAIREIGKTPAGKDLPAKYAHLSKYLRYIQLYDSVDVKIFDEIEQLEQTVKSKLFTSNEQVALDKLIRIHGILKKMFEFSLTKQDADFFYANRNDFKTETFSRVLLPIMREHHFEQGLPEGISQLDADLPRIEKFYEAAILRDHVLIQNAVQKMGFEKTPVSAIITGGFHTPGIEKYLAEKGYSYVIVTPKIEGALDTQKEAARYESAMSEKPLPIEQTLAQTYLAPQNEKLNDPRFQLAVELLLNVDKALGAESISGNPSAKAYWTMLAVAMAVKTRDLKKAAASIDSALPKLPENEKAVLRKLVSSVLGGYYREIKSGKDKNSLIQHIYVTQGNQYLAFEISPVKADVSEITQTVGDKRMIASFVYGNHKVGIFRIDSAVVEAQMEKERSSKALSSDSLNLVANLSQLTAALKMITVKDWKGQSELSAKIKIEEIKNSIEISNDAVALINEAVKLQDLKKKARYDGLPSLLNKIVDSALRRSLAIIRADVVKAKRSWKINKAETEERLAPYRISLKSAISVFSGSLAMSEIRQLASDIDAVFEILESQPQKTLAAPKEAVVTPSIPAETQVLPQSTPQSVAAKVVSKLAQFWNSITNLWNGLLKLINQLRDDLISKSRNVKNRYLSFELLEPRSTPAVFLGPLPYTDLPAYADSDTAQVGAMITGHQLRGADQVVFSGSRFVPVDIQIKDAITDGDGQFYNLLQTQAFDNLNYAESPVTEHLSEVSANAEAAVVPVQEVILRKLVNEVQKLEVWMVKFENNERAIQLVEDGKPLVQISIPKNGTTSSDQINVDGNTVTVTIYEMDARGNADYSKPLEIIKINTDDNTFTVKTVVRGGGGAAKVTNVGIAFKTGGGGGGAGGGGGSGGGSGGVIAPDLGGSMIDLSHVLPDYQEPSISEVVLEETRFGDNEEFTLRKLLVTREKKEETASEKSADRKTSYKEAKEEEYEIVDMFGNKLARIKLKFKAKFAALGWTVLENKFILIPVEFKQSAEQLKLAENDKKESSTPDEKLASTGQGVIVLEVRQQEAREIIENPQFVEGDPASLIASARVIDGKISFDNSKYDNPELAPQSSNADRPSVVENSGAASHQAGPSGGESSSGAARSELRVNRRDFLKTTVFGAAAGFMGSLRQIFGQGPSNLIEVDPGLEKMAAVMNKSFGLELDPAALHLDVKRASRIKIPDYQINHTVDADFDKYKFTPKEKELIIATAREILEILGMPLNDPKSYTAMDLAERRIVQWILRQDVREHQRVSGLPLFLGLLKESVRSTAHWLDFENSFVNEDLSGTLLKVDSSNVAWNPKKPRAAIWVSYYSVPLWHVKSVRNILQNNEVPEVLRSQVGWNIKDSVTVEKVWDETPLGKKLGVNIDTFFGISLMLTMAKYNFEYNKAIGIVSAFEAVAGKRLDPSKFWYAEPHFFTSLYLILNREENLKAEDSEALLSARQQILDLIGGSSDGNYIYSHLLKTSAQMKWRNKQVATIFFGPPTVAEGLALYPFYQTAYSRGNAYPPVDPKDLSGSFVFSSIYPSPEINRGIMGKDAVTSQEIVDGDTMIVSAETLVNIVAGDPSKTFSNLYRTHDDPTIRKIHERIMRGDFNVYLGDDGKVKQSAAIITLKELLAINRKLLSPDEASYVQYLIGLYVHGNWYDEKSKQHYITGKFVKMLIGKDMARAATWMRFGFEEGLITIEKIGKNRDGKQMYRANIASLLDLMKKVDFMLLFTEILFGRRLNLNNPDDMGTVSALVENIRKLKMKPKHFALLMVTGAQKEGLENVIRSYRGEVKKDPLLQERLDQILAFKANAEAAGFAFNTQKDLKNVLSHLTRYIKKGSDFDFSHPVLGPKIIGFILSWNSFRVQAGLSATESLDYELSEILNKPESSKEKVWEVAKPYWEAFYKFLQLDGVKIEEDFFDMGSRGQGQAMAILGDMAIEGGVRTLNRYSKLTFYLEKLAAQDKANGNKANRDRILRQVSELIAARTLKTAPEITAEDVVENPQVTGEFVQFLSRLVDNDPELEKQLEAGAKRSEVRTQNNQLGPEMSRRTFNTLAAGAVGVGLFAGLPGEASGGEKSAALPSVKKDLEQLSNHFGPISGRTSFTPPLSERNLAFEQGITALPSATNPIMGIGGDTEDKTWFDQNIDVLTDPAKRTELMRDVIYRRLALVDPSKAVQQFGSEKEEADTVTRLAQELDARVKAGDPQAIGEVTSVMRTRLEGGWDATRGLAKRFFDVFHNENKREEILDEAQLFADFQYGKGYVDIREVLSGRRADIKRKRVANGLVVSWGIFRLRQSVDLERSWKKTSQIAPEIIRVLDLIEKSPENAELYFSSAEKLFALDRGLDPSMARAASTLAAFKDDEVRWNFVTGLTAALVMDFNQGTLEFDTKTPLEKKYAVHARNLFSMLTKSRIPLEDYYKGINRYNPEHPMDPQEKNSLRRTQVWGEYGARLRMIEEAHGTYDLDEATVQTTLEDLVRTQRAASKYWRVMEDAENVYYYRLFYLGRRDGEILVDKDLSFGNLKNSLNVEDFFALIHHIQIVEKQAGESWVKEMQSWQTDESKRPEWMSAAELEKAINLINGDPGKTYEGIKDRRVLDGEAVTLVIQFMVRQGTLPEKKRAKLADAKNEFWNRSRWETFLQSQHMLYHNGDDGLPEPLPRGEMSPYLNQIAFNARSLEAVARIFKYDGLIAHQIQSHLASKTKTYIEGKLNRSLTAEEASQIAQIPVMNEEDVIGMSAYIQERQDLGLIGPTEQDVLKYLEYWLDDAAFVQAESFVASETGFFLPMEILQSAIDIFREGLDHLDLSRRHIVAGRFKTIFKVVDSSYKDLGTKQLNQIRQLRISYYVIFKKELKQAEEQWWLDQWDKLTMGLERKGIRSTQERNKILKFFITRMMTVQNQLSEMFYNRLFVNGQLTPEKLALIDKQIDVFREFVADKIIDNILRAADRKKNVKERRAKILAEEKVLLRYEKELEKGREERKITNRIYLTSLSKRTEMKNYLRAKSPIPVDEALLENAINMMIELGYNAEEVIYRQIYLPRVAYPKIYKKLTGKEPDLEKEIGKISAFTDPIFKRWGYLGEENTVLRDAIKAEFSGVTATEITDVESGINDELREIEERMKYSFHLQRELTKLGGKYRDPRERESLSNRIAADARAGGLVKDDLTDWIETALQLFQGAQAIELSVSDQELLFRVDLIFRLGVADLYQEPEYDAKRDQLTRVTVNSELKPIFADALKHADKSVFDPLVQGRNLQIVLGNQLALDSKRQTEITDKILARMISQKMLPADFKVLVERAQALKVMIDQARAEYEKRPTFSEAVGPMPELSVLEILIYLDATQPDPLKKIDLFHIFYPEISGADMIRFEKKVAQALNEKFRQDQLARFKNEIKKPEYAWGQWGFGRLVKWLDVENNGFTNIINGAVIWGAALWTWRFVRSGFFADPLSTIDPETGKPLIAKSDLLKWSPNQIYRFNDSLFESILDAYTMFLILWNFSIFFPFVGVFSPVWAGIFLYLSYLLLRMNPFLTLSQMVVFRKAVAVSTLWTVGIMLLFNGPALIAGTMALLTNVPAVALFVGVTVLLMVTSSNWFKTLSWVKENIGTSRSAGDEEARKKIYKEVKESGLFDRDPTIPVTELPAELQKPTNLMNLADDEVMTELRPWLPGGDTKQDFIDKLDEVIKNMAFSMRGNNDKKFRAILLLNGGMFNNAADAANLDKKLPVFSAGRPTEWTMTYKELYELIQERIKEVWSEFDYTDEAGVFHPGHERIHILVMPGGRKPFLQERFVRYARWGEDGTKGKWWGQKEYEYRTKLWADAVAAGQTPPDGAWNPEDDALQPKSFIIGQNTFFWGIPHLAVQAVEEERERRRDAAIQSASEKKNEKEGREKKATETLETYKAKHADLNARIKPLEERLKVKDISDEEKTAVNAQLKRLREEIAPYDQALTDEHKVFYLVPPFMIQPFFIGLIGHEQAAYIPWDTAKDFDFIKAYLPREANNARVRTKITIDDTNAPFPGAAPFINNMIMHYDSLVGDHHYPRGENDPVHNLFQGGTGYHMDGVPDWMPNTLYEHQGITAHGSLWNTQEEKDEILDFIRLFGKYSGSTYAFDDLFAPRPGFPLGLYATRLWLLSGLLNARLEELDKEGKSIINKQGDVNGKFTGIIFNGPNSEDEIVSYTAFDAIAIWTWIKQKGKNLDAFRHASEEEKGNMIQEFIKLVATEAQWHTFGGPMSHKSYEQMFELLKQIQGTEKPPIRELGPKLIQRPDGLPLIRDDRPKGKNFNDWREEYKWETFDIVSFWTEHSAKVVGQSDRAERLTSLVTFGLMSAFVFPLLLVMGAAFVGHFFGFLEVLYVTAAWWLTVVVLVGLIHPKATGFIFRNIQNLPSMEVATNKKVDIEGTLGGGLGAIVGAGIGLLIFFSPLALPLPVTLAIAAAAVLAGVVIGSIPAGNDTVDMIKTVYFAPLSGVITLFIRGALGISELAGSNPSFLPNVVTKPRTLTKNSVNWFRFWVFGGAGTSWATNPVEAATDPVWILLRLLAGPLAFSSSFGVAFIGAATLGVPFWILGTITLFVAGYLAYVVFSSQEFEDVMGAATAIYIKEKAVGLKKTAEQLRKEGNVEWAKRLEQQVTDLENEAKALAFKIIGYRISAQTDVDTELSAEQKEELIKLADYLVKTADDKTKNALKTPFSEIFWEALKWYVPHDGTAVTAYVGIALSTVLLWFFGFHLMALLFAHIALQVFVYLYHEGKDLGNRMFHNIAPDMDRKGREWAYARFVRYTVFSTLPFILLVASGFLGGIAAPFIPLHWIVLASPILIAIFTSPFSSWVLGLHFKGKMQSWLPVVDWALGASVIILFFVALHPAFQPWMGTYLEEMAKVPLPVASNVIGVEGATGPYAVLLNVKSSLVYVHLLILVGELVLFTAGLVGSVAHTIMILKNQLKVGELQKQSEKEGKYLENLEAHKVALQKMKAIEIEIAALQEAAQKPVASHDEVERLEAAKAKQALIQNELDSLEKKIAKQKPIHEEIDELRVEAFSWFDSKTTRWAFGYLGTFLITIAGIFFFQNPKKITEEPPVPSAVIVDETPYPHQVEVTGQPETKTEAPKVVSPAAAEKEIEGDPLAPAARSEVRRAAVSEAQALKENLLAKDDFKFNVEKSRVSTVVKKADRVGIKLDAAMRENQSVIMKKLGLNPAILNGRGETLIRYRAGVDSLDYLSGIVNLQSVLNVKVVIFAQNGAEQETLKKALGVNAHVLILNELDSYLAKKAAENYDLSQALQIVTEARLYKDNREVIEKVLTQAVALSQNNLVLIGWDEQVRNMKVTRFAALLETIYAAARAEARVAQSA